MSQSRLVIFYSKRKILANWISTATKTLKYVLIKNEDKKRYYKFEKGACYQMTSTWPVKDESGNILIHTMVMDVSSEGITKIVKFDDREFNDESYKKDKKLIEKNEELYIGDLSLCKAVEKFLGMQQSREEVIQMDGVRDVMLIVILLLFLLPIAIRQLKQGLIHEMLRQRLPYKVKNYHVRYVNV
ncbi:MAG: hypothetical protein LBU56_00050 [Rickettsiales bacterium]|nr:hypothetical protein [Rickettsiales bacterium]